MSATPLGSGTLAAGARLGRYQIVEPVGAGGMGEVYRALDTLLPRSVAIKTVRLGSHGAAARRRRLEREARIAARLSHPNICRLYDVGREGDVDFLVMEYLEGETLGERLRRGPLDLNDAIRLGTQIASALADAHHHGVIHRDLKPGNVMLTGEDERKEVRLLDFGIATRRETNLSAAADTVTEDPLTGEGQLVGTTSYMSPEQLAGRKADTRSDIFAFGVVFYEMLSGRHPFASSSPAGVMARILEHEAPALSLRTGTPLPALAGLIEGCLAKDPGERWQTTSRVVRELERCRRSQPQPPGGGGGTRADGRRDFEASREAAARDRHRRAHVERGASGAVASLARSEIRTATTRTGLVLGGFCAAAAAMYLNNPSVRDALLYPMLAVVGALPATLLTAAVAGLDGAAAARRVLGGLGSLVGTTLPRGQRSQRWVLGASLFLFFGAVMSLLLGHVADNVMPHLTFLPHPDSEYTEWAFSNPNDDWNVYRTRYKTAFLSHTSGTEADYQEQKHQLGRGSIRAARTLFCFGAILVAAGTIDLLRRRWRRGSMVLLAGVTACLFLYAIWHSREGNYVKEMVAASTRLPAEQRPALPDSAPEALRRLSEGTTYRNRAP